MRRKRLRNGPGYPAGAAAMAGELAMATALDDTQRAELARLLEQQEHELDTAVRRMREDIAAPGGAGGGWAEVRDTVESGDAQMLASLDLVQLRRQESELLEVRAARQRMHEGIYGRCEACDELIPYERLKLLPATRLCVRDEELREKAAHRPT